MAKYFTDEQLINLITDEKCYNEICDILKCDRGTVLRNAKRLGISVKPKKDKKNDLHFLEEVKRLQKLGKTTLEISTELNVSPPTIRKYLKILGKETNSVKNKRIVDVNLTSEQLEIIYGSLLGDLCISKTRNKARLSFNQGGKHEEYFDHLCSLFPGLLGRINKTPRYDNRTKKYYNKFYVRSLAHNVYLEIYNEVYINNVKTITKEWLSKITPKGIAYWFMDDGSKRGLFATNCFSEEECKMLQDMFLTKFNIKTRLYCPPNLNQCTLCIKQESLVDFENLIRPYIIPSMEYKLVNPKVGS